MKIRHILLGVLLIVAPVGSAGAADMAVKAPPMAPTAPVANWSGIYFGVTAGYGWGTSRQFDPIGNSTAPYSMSGVVGGPELGINWQYNRVVLGLEADFSFADIAGEGGTTPTWGCASPTAGCQTTAEWFATERGRAGYLLSDSLLVYGTGGVSEVRIENSIPACPAAGFGGCVATANTRTGWTAGGGLEYRYSQNASLKAEYLYIDVKQFQWTTFLAGTDPGLTYAHLNIVRLGLNYRFF